MVSGFEFHGPLAQMGPPISAGCSSDRSFAYSFLQIPPRGGHPCCSASSSHHQGLQSSRAKALDGLRMMPLFPLPPLKFRTVGFPQYGFKADSSGGAFQRIALLNPAPGIHVALHSLHPPFVSFQTGTWSPALSRAGNLLRYRHSSLSALPQGSSLRSGLCCPDPSTLNRPHPSHWQARSDFPSLRLYETPQLCGSALAAHQWVRAFPANPYRHVALFDSGEFCSCTHPVPSLQTRPSPNPQWLGFLINPTNPFRVGG